MGGFGCNLLWAPVPPGADAIVMQEETEPTENGGVRILRVPDLHQWIRRSGEDVTRGSVVLSKGERLAPASCGLAASIGMNQVLVARRVCRPFCAWYRARS